jgi:DNA-binding CsgD family transcriptional regulator
VIRGPYKKREGLSPRNIEVLILRCDGKTDGEIGTLLGITARGARWHIEKIQRFAEVNGTALLVRWAIKNKIISLETD